MWRLLIEFLQMHSRLKKYIIFSSLDILSLSGN